MIVTCPKCSAKYSVDASSLGDEGRKLKCSQCQNVWYQKPAEDRPHKIKETKAKPAAKKPKRKFKLRFGWIGFFSFITISILGCFSFRHTIVGIWPNMTPFYELFGFEVAPIGYGLEITDLEAIQSHGMDGKLYFFIKGSVVNITKSEKKVPNIVCILFDDESKEITRFTMAAHDSKLGGLGRTEFQGKFENNSLDSHEVKIIFQNDGTHYHKEPSEEKAVEAEQTAEEKPSDESQEHEAKTDDSHH